MLDPAIVVSNNGFIVYKPHNLPRADTASSHRPCVIIGWRWERVNQDVTSCGGCIRRGTDRERERGPDSVSEGSDIDIGQQWSVPGQRWPHGWGHPSSEVSRGLLMTRVMTSLIMRCPHLSRPHLSGLMISIVMTDARGHETHWAMSPLGSHAPYRLCMGQTRDCLS